MDSRTPHATPGPGRPLAHQYLQRLVRGDEAGARAVVDEAGAQGWSPARVYRISGVENGKQNPALGALLKLARALEVPLERLVLARGGG